jgi:hypothetical protein
MKFTVVSTPVADHQLAEIWLQSSDQQAVANASNEIDSLLMHDADQRGRAHPNGWRVLSVPPLVVTFKVSLDDRIAKIMSVYPAP